MTKSALWSLALLLAPAVAQTPPAEAAAGQRVDELVRAWRERERTATPKLAAEFAALGTAACPRLRQLMDEKEEDLPRESMAMALGMLRDPGSLAPLSRLLTRPGSATRYAAVEAIDRLSLAVCLPILAAAADDADDDVAGRACAALADWTDKQRMVETVLARLPDALAKGRLAQALAASGCDEAHAALLALLDGDETLVLAGLQALRRIATPDDAGRAAELLRRSSSIPIKREACQLLGHARHRAAVPDLIELLAQEHAGLAASAHWALKEITGQRLKADPALWREWWSRADRR